MARKAYTPLQLLIGLILLAIIPLIYIAAFNQFFGTAIPFTVENWILAFLVGILVVILFIVLLFIAVGGMAIAGPLGILLVFIAILLLPVLYIFSFNLLLDTMVPYTVESYLLVAVTIIGVWLLVSVASRVK